MFASNADLATFARDTIGATLLIDPKTQQPNGFDYLSVSIGASYYADDASQVLYRVVDPVAALIGDLDGRVVIGSTTMCLSTTGCTVGVPASYLEPIGAAVSGVEAASVPDGQLRTYNTSFFNKTYFPFCQYARHGGNIFLHASGLPNGPPPPLMHSIRACPWGTPGASCFRGFRGIQTCTCVVALPGPPPQVFSAGPIQMAVEVVFESSSGFLGDPTLGLIDLGVARAQDVDHLEEARGGVLCGFIGTDEENSFVEYETDGVCSGHSTHRALVGANQPSQDVTARTSEATLGNRFLCPGPPFNL